MEATKLWYTKKYCTDFASRDSLHQVAEKVINRYFDLLCNESTRWDALNMLSLDTGSLPKISIFRTMLGPNFGLLRRSLDKARDVPPEFIERVSDVFGLALVDGHPYAAKWVPKESCAKRSAKQNAKSLVKQVFKCIVHKFFADSRSAFRQHVSSINKDHCLLEQAMATKWKHQPKGVQVSYGAAARYNRIKRRKMNRAKVWTIGSAMTKYRTLPGPYWVPKIIRDRIRVLGRSRRAPHELHDCSRPMPHLRDTDRARLHVRPIVLYVKDITCRSRYLYRMVHFANCIGARCKIVMASGKIIDMTGKTFLRVQNMIKFVINQLRPNARDNLEAVVNQIRAMEPSMILYRSHDLSLHKSPKHVYISYDKFYLDTLVEENTYFMAQTLLPHAMVHYGRFEITPEEFIRYKLRRSRQISGHIKERVHLWLSQ